MLRAAIHKVSELMAICSTICTGVLMIAISLDVARRTVYGGSVPGVVEFSEALMVGIVFLGLADAEHTGSHVRVRLLTDRLPPRAAELLRGGSLALAGLLVGWMAWENGQRAWESYVTGEYRIGLLRFPQWPARTLLVLGLLLLLPEVGLKAFDSLRAAITGSMPHDPVEVDIVRRTV